MLGWQYCELRRVWLRAYLCRWLNVTVGKPIASSDSNVVLDMRYRQYLSRLGDG